MPASPLLSLVKGIIESITSEPGQKRNGMMGAFDFRVDGERRGTWNEVAEMISWLPQFGHMY